MDEIRPSDKVRDDSDICSESSDSAEEMDEAEKANLGDTTCFDILVKTGKGILTITVEKTDLVSDLKEKIYVMNHVKADQQSLEFQGR